MDALNLGNPILDPLPVFWFQHHFRSHRLSTIHLLPSPFPFVQPILSPHHPIPFKDSLGKLHPKLPSEHGYPEIDQKIDRWITLLVMHDCLGSHDVRPDGRRRARH